MPLGDEKHNLIYEELVNILGEEYVEDDPAIMEAFSRDALSMSYSTEGRAEFIVLPGSTEDVQQIIKLANRYQFPCSVSSTGQQLFTCCAVKGHPYWCFIDPKRMDHLYIDDKNMYAIVEPYVTVAQVQAEGMKHGLFIGVTGASTTGSALATNLLTNMNWTSWRTGIGRNLLGVECVLPNGDILRTGSLVTGDSYCWGEGPGIDAKGLLRGTMGALGALGVVTRAAIKCHPWPGPSVWPTEGVQPEKKSMLPPEKFKTFVFSYPTLEKCVDAVRELAEAEIGGLVMQFAPWDFVCWAAKTREEFWARWQTEYWQKQIHNGHMVWVTLWGFTSEKQVECEEKVLRQILGETGGELIPDEEAEWLNQCITPNAVRDTNRGRFLRLGTTGGVIMLFDSLYDTLRSIPMANEIKAKYTPPLGDRGLYDMGINQHKFWPADFGRVVAIEIDSFGDKTEEYETVQRRGIRRDFLKKDLEDSLIDTSILVEASLTGPVFANIHLLLASIKRALDPNNIANPPRLVNMDKIEEKKSGS